MRTIVTLSIALVLSLAANIVAVYLIGSTTAASAAKVEQARQAGAIAALKGRADQINRVALDADRDGRQLQAELRTVDAEATRRLQSYQAFVANLPPLPQGCGPGKARVDAINRLTGALP